MNVSVSTDAEELAGMRVLVVEDNFLVADTLRTTLHQMGCEVVGPVPSVERGVQLAKEECLAGAILDINIIGGSSASIAQVLMKRKTPFFFITGYGSPESLPESMKKCVRLNKPIDDRTLQATIRKEFRTEGGGRCGEE